jgi:flagellar biosynthesis regulator FlaF
LLLWDSKERKVLKKVLIDCLITNNQWRKNETPSLIAVSLYLKRGKNERYQKKSSYEAIAALN